MDFNPYAPPTAAASRANPYGEPSSDAAKFVDHRFPVAILIVIAIFTLGLYAPFWQLRRRSLFDSLGSDKRVGPVLPAIAALLILGGTGLAIAEVFDGSRGDFGENLGRVGGIVSLFVSFRMRYILRTRMVREISGVWTFFLGPLYLQAKINEIADSLGPA